MRTISKENIKLIKYLGLIFIAVAISYKLPHDSYSLMNYIIRPIRHKNSVIYISSIIPIILIIMGLKGIIGLEKFLNKNKIVIAFVILIFVIPFMKWTIDFSRINYHSLKNDGLKSIDIIDSDININDTNDNAIININLKLKDYSRRHSKFKIRVYLPKPLSEYTKNKYYELENYYEMAGNKYTLHVHEQILVDLKDKSSFYKLLETNWNYWDVKYELFHDKETVKFIKHGY